MILVVTAAVNDVALEHLALCLALRLPFFIVINKIDLGYCELQDTLGQLEKAIAAQNCNRHLVIYPNNKETTAVVKFDSNEIPVFPVSCVTGEGLDKLMSYIKDLSPNEPKPNDSDPESCLFQIDETFR